MQSNAPGIRKIRPGQVLLGAQKRPVRSRQFHRMHTLRREATKAMANDIASKRCQSGYWYLDYECNVNNGETVAWSCRNRPGLARLQAQEKDGSASELTPAMTYRKSA